MTPGQLRAARALLGISQWELARDAGLATSTIADFERGRRELSSASGDALLSTFREKGIYFTTGVGERSEDRGVVLRPL